MPPRPELTAEQSAALRRDWEEAQAENDFYADKPELLELMREKNRLALEWIDKQPST